MLALSGLFALVMALVLLFAFWQYQMNQGRFSFFSVEDRSVSEQEKYDILESLRIANGAAEISFEEKIETLRALGDLETSPATESTASEGMQASVSGSGSVQPPDGHQSTGSEASASREEKLRILESLRE